MNGAALSQAVPVPVSDNGAPVVNYADGIARLMGDGALFARVLARFRKDYRDAAPAIRRALDDGDRALTLRLAHTLKGAAGMIEAVPLWRATLALEQELDSSTISGDSYARLAQLERALAQVLRELDAAADSMPSPGTPAPSLAGAHPDAFKRLHALLGEGNGEAVDLVRAGEATLRAEIGDVAYGRVAAAIESYDFDAALVLLVQPAGD